MWYQININYGYELIKKEHTKKLECSKLNVKNLAAIVGDSNFSIVDSDEQFENSYIITWYTYRLESTKEREQRINKAEEYNKKAKIKSDEWENGKKSK
jgi:hypothetical protein